MIKVAINGFGRIGRQALKAAWDKQTLDIVAINDLTDTKTLAHLLKHDTAYHAFDHKVSYDDNHIIIDDKSIICYQEKDPSQLPWKDHNIDVVIESTGFFRDKKGASLHIHAGAKRVVISAPGKGDGIKEFVRGVNCDTYNGEEILDNASCTTNCVAPVVALLESAFGIEKAILTTIHSYTTDQHLQDGPHRDLRRARAAAQNIVPTTTGSAIATTRVVPSLKGKFDGMAIRIPTITVSLTDFTFVVKKDVTKEEVNDVFLDAVKQKRWQGILDVTTEELVSSDFVGNPHSSIVDLNLTNVVGGNLVKVIAWYDNEWGYSHRLVEMVEIAGESV